MAVASLGALLFGLHVAIVNGLQDAVSAELGFSANTGLRGAVSLCISLYKRYMCLVANILLQLALADGFHGSGWGNHWQYFR